MGRPYKPHTDLHIRFDDDLYKRLKGYVEMLNEQERDKRKRLTTVTDIVEEAVFLYLNEKEDF